MLPSLSPPPLDHLRHVAPVAPGVWRAAVATDAGVRRVGDFVSRDQAVAAADTCILDGQCTIEDRICPLQHPEAHRDALAHLSRLGYNIGPDNEAALHLSRPAVPRAWPPSAAPSTGPARSNTHAESGVPGTGRRKAPGPPEIAAPPLGKSRRARAFKRRCSPDVPPHALAPVDLAPYGHSPAFPSPLRLSKPSASARGSPCAHALRGAANDAPSRAGGSMTAAAGLLNFFGGCQAADDLAGSPPEEDVAEHDGPGRAAEDARERSGKLRERSADSGEISGHGMAAASARAAADARGGAALGGMGAEREEMRDEERGGGRWLPDAIARAVEGEARRESMTEARRLLASLSGSASEQLCALEDLVMPRGVAEASNDPKVRNLARRRCVRRPQDDRSSLA